MSDPYQQAWEKQGCKRQERGIFFKKEIKKSNSKFVYKYVLELV